MSSDSTPVPSTRRECRDEESARTHVLAIAVAAVAAGWAPSSLAFDLQRAEPQFIDGEYRFDMTAVLEAPIDAVERILRDYENYPTLDTRILDAKVIERPQERVAILATTLRACFGPVCRTVKRVERVEEKPQELIAITDPVLSQMRFGETHMALASDAMGNTVVTYRTRLQPDFWIPALIARRMMLETLEDATLDLFRSVEEQAQAAAAEEVEIRDSRLESRQGQELPSPNRRSIF